MTSPYSKASDVSRGRAKSLSPRSLRRKWIEHTAQRSGGIEHGAPLSNSLGFLLCCVLFAHSVSPIRFPSLTKFSPVNSGSFALPWLSRYVWWQNERESESESEKIPPAELETTSLLFRENLCVLVLHPRGKKALLFHCYSSLFLSLSILCVCVQPFSASLPLCHQT